MKLVLIEPNTEGYALMPTMSLAILKSFINNKTNHEAKIIDLIFHKKNWKEYLRNKLEQEKPDLIGLSVLSFNLSQALEIVSFIKKNFDVKIIFGGVHAILMEEETLKNKYVDMVCIGEGELTLKELLDKKLNPKNVKGIWYKEGEKIIGFTTRGGHVSVHGINCPMLKGLESSRFIEAKWLSDKSSEITFLIHVDKDRVGLLRDIIDVFAKHNVNLSRFGYGKKTSPVSADLTISARVKDLNLVSHLMDRIEEVDGVAKALYEK